MKLQTVILLVLGPTVPLLAGAQEVEPRVQTSSAAAPTQPTDTPPAPHALSTPPAKAPAAAPKANAAAPTPSGDKTAAPKVAEKAGDKADRKPGNRTDRIQLDTTEISGNQELPKVMYVVPWRKAEPGDFSGRPPNSLLDEALTPVDRDVFRRQNRYYGVLQGQSQGSVAEPASKDEK